MKKTVLFLTFLLLGLTIFAQYTGNKLPSGLTVADTANDADYTIIQKSGETYVKAIRMDSLRSYMTEEMAANVIELDSVAGNTGQFIISDGSGWLAPVSAKYEGSDAYTFGSRLSGAIGSGSIVLGRGRATAARSFTINGITASGVDAVAINGAIASGDRSAAINQGTASGDDSFAWNSGIASSISSTAWNSGVASGYNSTAWIGGYANGDKSTAWIGGDATGNYSTAWISGVAGGNYSTAWNSGIASGDNSTAWGSGIASGNSSTAWNNGISQSYLETSFGQYADTATTKTTGSWVATDRLLTIGNGTGEGSESNALVMLKNGNTTVNGNWTFSDTIMADEGFIKNKAHGFYAFEDSSVIIDCTLNTWVQITNGTNDLFTAVQDNAGFTISGDTIYFSQPTLAGMTPHIVFHYGIDGHAGNNEDYEVRIFNVSNNAGVMRKSEGSTTGAANRIEIGTTAYDNTAAFGDAYILQIVNRTNSNDFTIENGSVYLEVSHY